MTRRPPGKAECPGPHSADTPGWRDLDAVVCRRCWWQLPLDVRRRIRQGIPPGASAACAKAVIEQLAIGVPLRDVRARWSYGPDRTVTAAGEPAAEWCPTCQLIVVQPDRHQCTLKEAR